MHDYTIPFGPQHKAIKEPICIKLSLDGNIIREAKFRLGYVHRGIEHLLEGKRIEQALFIAEKICGICSYAHSGCFNQTIERMLKFDPTRRVKYIRTLIAELERIHSHSLWAGFMLHEIGFGTMFQYFMRDREHVLEIFERITGGRVHHAINKPRTVRHDISESDKRFILNKMSRLEERISDYLETIEKDPVIKSRLVDVGIIDKKRAKRYCLVGPVVRASGIKNDIRKNDPYEAYDEMDFDVIIGKSGDAHERMIVRMKEILESIKIIRQLLKNMPEGRIPKSSLVFIEEAMETGRVEAPRGENFYMVRVKENKVYRAKIRTPTFATIGILPVLLENREIGDVPVVIASLDPCFGCMERLIVIKNGKQEVLTEDDFRRKYT